MIKKFFKNKNENDKAIGAVGALFGLTVYIFLISMVLSFLLVNIYGTSNIAGIKLPSQSDIQTFSSSQNFKSGNFDLNTTGQDINSKWVYTSGIGMVLTELGQHTYSYFGINNIQEDESAYYQNSYWINNTPVNVFGNHNDYSIILRFTGGVDQNEILVEDDGFHIPIYLLNANFIVGDNYFFAYPNANQVEYPVIKTIYNDKDLSLDFYFEGSKIFTTTQLNTDANLFGLWGRYYGGVGSHTQYFTLEQFDTSNTIISTSTTNGSDVIGMLASLFVTIIKISTWQIPAWILPVELVVIFITLPEAGILVCAAFIIIRGVD
jgi:hypothetical protein